MDRDVEAAKPSGWSFCGATESAVLPNLVGVTPALAESCNGEAALGVDRVEQARIVVLHTDSGGERAKLHVMQHGATSRTWRFLRVGECVQCARR